MDEYQAGAVEGMSAELEYELEYAGDKWVTVETALAYAGELREERDALIRTNEELSKSYRELQADCERAESALASARRMIWHQIHRNHDYTEMCDGCKGAMLFSAPENGHD